MFGADNRIISKKNIFHLVLICDHNGITDAFKVIKDHLGSSCGIILSLIYTIPNNYPNPLFQRELSIMEKRFPWYLYTHILEMKPGDFEYLQEFIEAIINSNTLSKMQFSVFGNEVFVKYVCEFLQYLNVDKCSIELNMA